MTRDIPRLKNVKNKLIEELEIKTLEEILKDLLQQFINLRYFIHNFHQYNSITPF